MKEILAKLMHKIWSKWITYLFAVSVRNADGSVTIPVARVNKWVKQMETEYEELTEEEKNSDRNIAQVVIGEIKDYMGLQ